MPSPDRRETAISGWIPAVAIATAFAALSILERRQPLRPGIHEKMPRRQARNLAMAALAGMAVQHLERPVTRRLTHLSDQRRIGLLSRLHLPDFLDTLISCLLLDYTLYGWHILTHRIPFLWRFHRVHHADLDMDASTGLRFHFGEMACSVIWRAVQIFLIGVSTRALSVWNMLLLIEVMFHHSNVRLSRRVERILGRFIVTPRMHGIHHSIRRDEMDSNWSSGLSVWDRLHRTLRLGNNSRALTIGLPDLREPCQVALPKLIAMPFTIDDSS